MFKSVFFFLYFPDFVLNTNKSQYKTPVSLLGCLGVHSIETVGGRVQSLLHFATTLCKTN